MVLVFSYGHWSFDWGLCNLNSICSGCDFSRKKFDPSKTIQNTSRYSTLGKINSVFPEVAEPRVCKSRLVCGSLVCKSRLVCGSLARSMEEISQQCEEWNHHKGTNLWEGKMMCLRREMIYFLAALPVPFLPELVYVGFPSLQVKETDWYNWWGCESYWAFSWGNKNTSGWAWWRILLKEKTKVQERKL